MKLTGYWTAMSCGARGRGVRAAVVPAEVLLARFRYGLGPRLYSLYRLWRKPMKHWADYIDDHPNKPWLQAVNPAEPRRIVDDKVAFHFHCREHDLPTVPIVGRIGRARNALDARLPEVTGPEPLESLLRKNPDGLFIKPPGGSHGEGAFSVVAEGGEIRWLDKVSSVAEMYAFCRGRVGCCWRMARAGRTGPTSWTLTGTRTPARSSRDSNCRSGRKWSISVVVHSTECRDFGRSAGTWRSQSRGRR
jgi:hypothetical protein